MLRAGIVAAGLLAGASSVAGAASLQEEFNAAQAAVEAGDFAKAAAGFEKVLAKLPVDPKNHTAALVRARLGGAQRALGRFREAAEALELALPGLAGEADWIDRLDTQLELGRAREALLDYDEAQKVYNSLLSELESRKTPSAEASLVHRKALISTRAALARIGLFDDPDAARRQLDLVLPEAEALLGQTSDQLGEIYTLRGRAELMAGNLEGARIWLEKALAAAGGLGRKVTASDIRIRGDLGLVAQLMGHEGEARKYLAYTGTGTAGKKNPLGGADMPLPACGEATGLYPDDAAVVEFAVGDEGQVTFAQPIYATRTGSVALEFARAVTEWSWSPEDIRETTPFWRSSLRVELRCTKDVQRADIFSTFVMESEEWLQSRQISLAGIKAVEGESAVRQAALLRSTLAARETEVGKEDVSLLPLMLRLSINPTVTAKYRKELVLRAEAIAKENAAPVGVRAVLKFLDIRNQPGLYGSRWLRVVRDGYSAFLADLRRRNEAQSRGGAWVMAELANIHERLREVDRARQLYEEVLALPETIVFAPDPVRQLAVVRLASLKAAAKQFDEADRLLQAAGLSPEQCELVDVMPIALNVRMTSDDFPREAQRWGFEGWVQISYDIDTDGRVVEPRTVIAYPPFVFSSATEKTASRFRYQPIYRAGKNIGCTGYTFKVRYGAANY